MVNKVNQSIVDGETSECVMGELERDFIICKKIYVPWKNISRVCRVE